MQPRPLSSADALPRPDATREIVIKAANLGKCYHIYDKPQDRLKQAIIPRLYRFGGPFTKKRRALAYFREFWALKDVSLEVRKGETLGIMGRNGAGKSTLLQIVAGTLTATSGSINVQGKVAALLELGSGFNPEFTGKENVYLNASLSGLTNQETNERFDEIAAFADIGNFIDQPVKTYSSGMMVRLAFAVHAVLAPAVLIVDEALAVGDAKFQKKCYDRIQRFRNEGGTVLFATHDVGIVVQICDRALILEEGHVYNEGEPHRIAKVYHRLLFGSPSEGAGFIEKETSAPRISKMHPDDVRPSGEGPGSKPPAIAPIEERAVTEQGGARELRYGSQRAEITKVGARELSGSDTALLEAEEVYEFYFRGRLNADIDERLAFGFTISNLKGLEIYGTKGQLYGLYIPPGHAGKAFECRMRLAISLVPGTYFLTTALAPASSETDAGSSFYDYRFDAFEFKVIGNPKCFSTSIVNLNAALEVKDV
jgi:lipopolysaccharide transport system ATP-binding protein